MEALIAAATDLASLQRYQEALRDAKHIVAQGPPGPTHSGPARARVKQIEDFLENQRKGVKGHEQASATLVCLLTPREHRQWRAPTPSTYTRAYPFGL